MSEIKKLSVEEAALNYATKKFPTENGEGKVTDWAKEESFRKGAEWQKEQLKAHMQKIIDTLENDFAKQLVANVTNILFS